MTDLHPGDVVDVRAKYAFRAAGGEALIVEEIDRKRVRPVVDDDDVQPHWPADYRAALLALVEAARAIHTNRHHTCRAKLHHLDEYAANVVCDALTRVESTRPKETP